MLEYWNLTFSVQAAIASGYLAYCVAYAGYRRHHTTKDTVFITLVFSAIASALLGVVAPDQTSVTYSGVAAAMLCAFVTVLFAAVWRVLGRKLVLKVLSLARVHREDGIETAWEGIVQTTSAVDQVSVHLRSKRILYLNNRRQYKTAPWSGLYLGGDGSIVMIVEEEELSDGTTEVREGITDDDWGTRLTYIPSSEIERVNLRMT